MKLFVLVFSLFYISFCQSQSRAKENKNFNVKELHNYKIEEDVFNFWWNKYDYRWFPENDTIPYFVDERSYKGVINYGVKFSAANRKIFNFMENFSLHKMNIQISHLKANFKDSIVEIEGTITGGWNIKEFGSQNNGVDIFIGKKKDTISYYHFEYLLDTTKVNITYKDKKVRSHIVLDSFPSFYMHDYTHYKTNRGKVRTFKIKSKVNENSIIVFGLRNCFSEIYDVGEMIYPRLGIKNSEIRNKTKKTYPQVIIRNNIQELNKAIFEKTKPPRYYLITEKAENYILSKQYGKAKQQYDLLLNDYKYIFARDIHNAVRTAIWARDVRKAILWCEKLVLKGVKLNYFEAPIFNRIKKNILWEDFLDKFPQLNKIHKKGLNQALINGLKQIIDRDQEYYIKNSKGKVKRSKLIEITELNDNDFIGLIEKHGFPTEEKIGVQVHKGTLIVRHPLYYVLIRHSHQTKSNRKNEIKQILAEKTRSFEYDMRDDLDIFLNNGSCFQIYKGNLYNMKTCGISNQNQLKKIIFKFKNKDEFIIEGGKYVIIPYEKDNESEDDKFFEEQFNFVMKLTDDWFFYEK
jgi:hypothetical protein